MDESYVKSIGATLPEELLRLKYAGYFDEFEKRAQYHLDREDLPDLVKQHIELELYNCRTIKDQYPLTEAAVVKKIASYCPGFTQEDFDRRAGDTDWIFINGKKRYADMTVDALFITSKELREWPGSTYPKSTGAFLLGVRNRMRAQGKLSVTSDVEFTGTIDPKAAAGHTLKVHLPFPSPLAKSMSGIELLSSSEPCYIAPETALQRTAYFETDGDKTRKFSIKVRATMTQDYMSFEDMLKAGQETTPAKERRLRKQIRPSDLEEKIPHYVFSPALRSLSEKIVGDETNKTLIAKKIYDWMVKYYDYAYVRDYALIDNIGEYFAIRGRGDCGIQASLFITLCRLNGIPARWESGITTDEGGGMHDWAQVYLEGVGFRPVDCSYGNGMKRRNMPEECDFYFGNMDPYRWVCNTDFQEPFDPPKSFYRVDPYDNQCGEAETECGMLTRKEFHPRRKITNQIEK